MSWPADSVGGQRASKRKQEESSGRGLYGDLGQAFPAWPAQARAAILQPPMPEIPPSPEILQRVMDRDADWEAAD